MKDPQNILISAPDPLTRQELVGRLEGQGYQAMTVERGSDALLAVAEGNVRLVILDISTQEPSGARTVEILRKIRPRLPVIVLSGDHSVETGRQILQYGVLYYFLKPFDLEELDQIVRIALGPKQRFTVDIEQSASRAELGEEKGTVL